MVIRSRAVLALVTWIARMLGAVPSWSRVAGFAFPPPLIFVDPGSAEIHRIVAHEQVHVDQWAECAIALGFTSWPLLLVIPVWAWVLLVYAAWPVLYAILWLAGLLRHRSSRAAYRWHPMELEADAGAEVPGYLVHRQPFAWLWAGRR